MINENGDKLIKHHTKYLELHGEDKIVLMTRSDHTKLHHRLRKEGKCNVPSTELGKISKAAARRERTGIMYIHEQKKECEVRDTHDIEVVRKIDKSVVGIVELRRHGLITIPKDTRKAGDMKPGDMLQLEITIVKRAVE